MNETERDELREKYEAATQGNWFGAYSERDADVKRPGSIGVAAGDTDGWLGVCICGEMGSEYEAASIADSEYIAAAHNALPSLLADSERAEKLEGMLRDALQLVERQIEAGTYGVDEGRISLFLHEASAVLGEQSEEA